MNPGANPTETALVEYFELPVNESGQPIEGFSPRGMDVDRNGVAWVALASGHLASFDCKKCKVRYYDLEVNTFCRACGARF